MTIKYNYEWGGYQAQQLYRGELITVISTTPASALSAVVSRVYKLSGKLNK